MKYRIPLTLTFDGCALIEADDEVTAEDIACSIVANLGHVSDNGYNEIKDYEFDLHGYATRRDNESIEEIEEEEEADSKKDIVKIICYGEVEQLERSTAIEKYDTAVLCSDGSERERYAKILAELLDNRKICSDGEE